MEPYGAGNVFGNFVQGYFQGMQVAEQQKQAKLSNLMRTADHYRKWLDDLDPQSDEDTAHAFHIREQLSNVLDQVDKIQSDKSGAWSFIKKLVGKGKKGDGGTLNAIARIMPEYETVNMPLGGGGATPAAAPQGQPQQLTPPPDSAWLQSQAEMQAMGVPVEQPAPGLTPPPETPGELVAQKQKETPLPEPKPMTIPVQMPTQRYLDQMKAEEERQKREAAAKVPWTLETWPYKIDDPKAPGGKRNVSPGMWRDAMARRAALLGTKDVQEDINRTEREADFQIRLELMDYERDLQRVDRAKNLEIWKKSPERAALSADEQAAADSMIGFGYNPPHSGYQFREMDKGFDPVKAARLTQLVKFDPNDPNGTMIPVGPVQENAPSPYDQRILAYWKPGMEWAEAQRLWAKDQMGDAAMDKMLKELQIANSQELLEMRREKNRLAQLAKEGKLDKKGALDLIKLVYQDARAGAPHVTNTDPKTGATYSYIPLEVLHARVRAQMDFLGFDYDKLVGLAGGDPEKRAAEQEERFGRRYGPSGGQGSALKGSQITGEGGGAPAGRKSGATGTW